MCWIRDGFCLASRQFGGAVGAGRIASSIYTHAEPRVERHRLRKMTLTITHMIILPTVPVPKGMRRSHNIQQNKAEQNTHRLSNSGRGVRPHALIVEKSHARSLNVDHYSAATKTDLCLCIQS